MILTENTLREWEESSLTPLNFQQRKTILERFGIEPEPYEWSEQDIAVQIRIYLECDEFENSIADNSDVCSTLPYDTKT